MELVLLPWTETVNRQYLSFFRDRRAQEPMPGAECGVFIGPMEQTPLVCGTLLYPTSGAYLVVEHVATNLGVPKRERHRAVVLSIGFIQIYATLRGKIPMYMPRDQGVSRILSRLGAVKSDAALWTIPLGVAAGPFSPLPSKRG